MSVSKLVTKLVDLDLDSEIFSVIGDTTNTNRSPSVNQAIRYLTRKNATKNQRKLGSNLKVVYLKTRGTLRNSRLNFRTDALSLAEFIDNVEFVA
jgi:metal-responsive CopG/Arc/MetJ family transcriptional regulator